MTLLITFAVIVAVSGLVFVAGMRLWGGDSRLEHRLGDLGGASGESRKPRRTDSVRHLVPDRALSAVPKLANQLIPNSEAERNRLQIRLLKAGIYTANGLRTCVTIKLLLMVVPPLIGLGLAGSGLVRTDRGLLIGAVCGGVGMVLPGLWLDRRKVRRHGILRRSLPDFLDLLVACLESGHSLHKALLTTSQELRVAHPLLAGEMTIVQHEVELGGTIDTAFRNFAERTGMDGLKTLSTFVQQSIRMGTSLADAMRTLADTLRNQREQAAEEIAQKASVKILIPMLIFIFPVILIVLAGPAVIQLQERLGR
jgi:tight adherence protein C